MSRVRHVLFQMTQLYQRARDCSLTVVNHLAPDFIHLQCLTNF